MFAHLAVRPDHPVTTNLHTAFAYLLDPDGNNVEAVFREGLPRP